jgi:hypothetical protein|tara:strand:- start:1311 stop:1550 length:240 start_codon:yes stop_codon:yes gene_type:complete
VDLIRKIVVGQNPKDAMAYYVGQRAGESRVHAIVKDEKALSKYSVRRWLIYIENESDGIMLWKTIEDMPCLVEYDCKFE